MIAADVDRIARSALIPLLDAPLPGARARGGQLPDPLQRRYGGPLAIPLRRLRPTVIANFVSTLDGVVAYNTPEAAGGGEISGFFEPDRFVMGLLRALSDAVLIGAGTLRAAPAERWTPDFIHPGDGAAFMSLRCQLGLRPQPVTAVVSGSGNLDMDHPGLADAPWTFSSSRPMPAPRLWRGVPRAMSRSAASAVALSPRTFSGR